MSNDDLSVFAERISSWIADDEEKIVDLCSRLVQCETPSPPGNTRAAMTLVKAFLDAEGLAYRDVDYDDTMPNLISSVRMPSEGRHLMFNGHLDVFRLATNRAGPTIRGAERSPTVASGGVAPRT